jgi:hypothetical protein
VQLVQPLGSRPPSPRVRGEGRGEGASPQSSDSRQRPLTRIVPLRSSSDLSPRSGRGEKSKSALAARARPSSADAKGKKALRHDLVRSGRRWDRRRHDHAQQNPIRRRMSICSPDEAQRNPGTIARLATPTPDFTSFIRATKGKGGGTPADAYLQPPRPHLHPPPRAGEDRGGGAARVHADKCTQVCAHKIHATRRLSAFHRGACCSEPTPQLSSGRASWDAEFPVPVQRAPRRPVVVPAGRCSEAARERR